MSLRAVIAAVFVPLLAAAATPTPASPEAAAFTLGVGANQPLGGEEQNGFFPCGGGPASFDVDADGHWWILDAIGSRLVVTAKDGSVARTIALPTTAKKPAYYSDVALDGAGGALVLDSTARRIVHVGADGSVTNSFGGEKIPKGKGPHLDLPRRIHFSGGALYVEDGGSDALLRFAPDGSYRDAALAPSAIPNAGGLFALTQSGGATWLEAAPAGGHRRPLAKLKAAEGRELRDAWLVGATAAGDAVLVQREGVTGKDDADRLRILRIDAKGKIAAERELPDPDDGVSPTRRFRLTPDGHLARFELAAGRFSAFVSAL